MQINRAKTDLSDERMLRRQEPMEIPVGEGDAMGSNYEFYKEYQNIYRNSYGIVRKIKELLKEKEELWHKVSKLYRKTEEQFKDEIRGENNDRKKRNRRTAEEIQKKHVCPAQRCGRNYGTEGSLQQHIKLKHPELYEHRKNSQNEDSDSQNESS